MVPSKSNTNGHYPPRLVYSSEEGALFQGDCVELLNQMVTNSVDMAFVDPPFNLGKDYETESFTDSLADERYRNWCRTWLLQLIRVLRPGGTLLMYHWPKWLIDLGAYLNSVPSMKYRSWIAVNMKAGFPIRNRLHPAHYGILYYTKVGGRSTFNVVRYKAPVCRHCGKELRDYGGYRGKFKKYEDDDGIPWVQISDFWQDTRPARQDKSRQVQIAELPLHIPERLVLMASNPGDVILDVFGGSGSTFHACQLHSRRWIGCEIGEVTAIMQRLRTVFGLADGIVVGTEIGKCFKPTFIKKEFAAFVGEDRISVVKAVEPFKNVPRSFNEDGSKSKVLGF